MSIFARPLTAKLKAIQKHYWKFDAKEKDGLIGRGPLSLPWPEMLRLNHLCCLEMLRTKAGKRYLRDPNAYPEDPSVGLDTRSCPFWPELLQKLASPESPYKPRVCLVWKGDSAVPKPNEPELSGPFLNPSITHLGSFEVFRADSAMNPDKAAFVPLSEMARIVFGAPGMFRSAKLTYHDGREAENVWVPLLYGMSWMSSHAEDRNGSSTRFVGHQEISIGGVSHSLGIGIGHQDLRIQDPADEGRDRFFGLGSLEELAVAPELDDPKFEQNCLDLGLTPEDMRRILKGGQKTS